MSELDLLISKIENSNFSSKNELTKELILVLALGHLGGLKNLVYTESIAAQAFEWVPAEFSWSMDEYRKYPDKEAARRPLLNARDKYKLISGAYARELSKDGWRLTSNGEKVFRKLNYLLKTNSHKSKLSKNEIVTIKKTITNKDLYKNFLSEKEQNTYLNINSLADQFDSSPDKEDSIRRKFFRKKAQVQFIDDVNLKNFFSFLEKSFSSVLKEDLFFEEQKVKKRSK